MDKKVLARVLNRAPEVSYLRLVTVLESPIISGHMDCNARLRTEIVLPMETSAESRFFEFFS